MGNITFMEKEPFRSETMYFNGMRYPVYMIKNGVEYFLWNRSLPADYGDEETQDARKIQLLENEGKYFKFYDHSGYNSPIAFIEWVKNKNLHLRKGFTAKILEDGKTFDFRGNLKEISCAFFYRVFDETTIKEIKKIISEV